MPLEAPLRAESHTNPNLEMSDREFQSFRDLVALHTGISLNDGKRSMLSSRLAKRLRSLSLATFDDYYALLTLSDPAGQELRQFINCVTTNKTSFFRESAHFDFVRREIQRRRQLGSGGLVPRQLSIWSAPCSTGEEAYSIAITVSEALNQASNWQARILASDIDTAVLGRAGRGVYQSDTIDSLPPDIKQHYFLKGRNSADGFVLVKPFLRRMIDFRRINLVEPIWSVHETFDIIFCRNVLIYFDRPTQDRLIRRLIQQLKPDGYLIVGQSEHLHWLREVVEPVSGTVYRARRSERRSLET